MAGIFHVVCPGCGQEVSAVDAEHWVCGVCDQAYLVGVGHLIPVEWSIVLADRAAGDDRSLAGA